MKYGQNFLLRCELPKFMAKYTSQLEQMGLEVSCYMLYWLAIDSFNKATEVGRAPKEL